MHLFSLLLENGRPPIQVLVAQFSNEQSIASLFDLVYADSSTNRRRASAIVLRPDVTEHFSPADVDAAVRGQTHKNGAFLDAVASACSEEALAFARFEDIPIFVLHSDRFEHRLSGNINPSAVVPVLVEEHLSDPATLGAIRSHEFDHLVACSRAQLMPVEGAYYDPPSHRPMRSFLRIGNLQYSRHAVDALAFWLLPHVASARGILIDTWSISSIAFNLSRILALYDGRPPVPVEMLSRYQDRSPEAQAALLEVLDRLWVECSRPEVDEVIPITCIVSATQSGSLVEVLQDEIESAGLPVDMRFVALFQLGKTDALPSLCDRSNAPEFAPLPPDAVKSRSAIHIDPQVYFPLAYRDMEFVLRKKQAEAFAGFVDLFGTDGIFSSHRDQRSDGLTRHHAVHVDTERVVATPAFGEAFEREIRALVPSPVAVLTPQHDVARALGERAIAVLAESGHTAVHLQHPSLLLRQEGPSRVADAYVRSVLSQLGEADSLLILDDCFITGDRLYGYQTRLRQQNVRARLHYRVAIARPEDMEHWRQCQKMLTYRGDADKAFHATNTVNAIHALCLPNWQEPDCPWCAELMLYHRMLKQGQTLPNYIQQRLARLTNRDRGLVNSLFLVAPESGPLELYSGSIFVPPRSPQASVFAAVASALQQLRTIRPDARPALGRRRYPVATVLKAREYLKEVYTDSILRASVLRAACPEELVYMNESAERRRTGLATTLLTSAKHDECDVALELILAHAAGKCGIDPNLGNGRLNATAAQLLANLRSLRD